MRDRPSSLRPWLVEGVSNAVSIAAGRATGAAVTRSGETLTWGLPPLGRTGPGHTAQAVSGLTGHHAVAVCMGEYHGTIITSAGKLLGWGSTGEGQVQDVDGTPLSDTVAELRGWPVMLRATGLACGFQHSLVVGSSEPRRNHVSASGGVRDGLSSKDAQQAGKQAPGLLGTGLFSFWPSAHALFAPLTGVAGSVANRAALGGSISAPAAPQVSVNLSDLRENGRRDAFGQDTDTGMDSGGVDDQPRVLEPSSPTSFPRRNATLETGVTAWPAQACPNGPKPPWVVDCALVPDTISRLDKAWFGRFQASAQAKVRTA